MTAACDRALVVAGLLRQARGDRPTRSPSACARRCRAATRRRMVADVPLGAFLSGGIDSSAVVAAMAEAVTEPVQDVLDRLRRRGLRRAAARAPDRRALRDRAPRARSSRPTRWRCCPKIVRHYGEPFADSSAIPSFYLAELHAPARHRRAQRRRWRRDLRRLHALRRQRARRRGSTACRSRCGARCRRGGRALPAGGTCPAAANRARRLAGALALDPRPRYARYVSVVRARAARARSTRAGFARRTSTPRRGRACSPGRGRQLAAPTSSTACSRSTSTPTSPATCHEDRHRDDGLRARGALAAARPRADGARRVDPRRAEGPRREKKWILREALRGWLPDEILDRPKRGFCVPFGDWLRGDLRGMSHDVLLDPGRSTAAARAARARGLIDRHAAGADDDAQRIWALLMLELWHRDVAVATRRRAGGVGPYPARHAGRPRGGSGGAAASRPAMPRRRLPPRGPGPRRTRRGRRRRRPPRRSAARGSRKAPASSAGTCAWP